VTESAQPMESRQLFYIKRYVPFRFKVNISVEEEPMNIDQQDQYTSPVLDEIDEMVAKMKE